MLQILRFFRYSVQAQSLRTPNSITQKRAFLSPAYYCNEVWSSRLSSPILQKVNLDVLYHDLEQKFLKTRHISAVDVDIFTNSLTNDLFVDEMMDLIHKLRLSSETGNTLESTSHAVIRLFLENNREHELLLTLDDRLNYGIFLDHYTANILLDTFWKKKNYMAGAFVASQMMLQEDFSHPLTQSLSILHCYNYLLNPTDNWPKPKPLEEPEEEVKVRVKYLRNPYFDDHFDLKDPKQIVGKTLVYACTDEDSALQRTLRTVGYALWGKEDTVASLVEKFDKEKIHLIKEIVNLLPEENSSKDPLLKLASESANVDALLHKQISEYLNNVSEKDIVQQCKLFDKWQNDRIKALEEQKEKLLTIERLKKIEKLKTSLDAKEQKLWFFENQEKIELAIEESEIEKEVIQVKKNKTKAEITKEENEYIPPEIVVKRTNT